MALTVNDVSFSTFLSVEFGDFYGSGFRLTHNEVDYVVTAKHVLYNKDELLTDLFIKSRNYYGDIEDGYSAKVDLTEQNVTIFPNSDIALVKLDANCNLFVENTGKNIVSASIEDTISFKEVSLAQNILSIGFPSSLTIDSFYDMDRPLLRTGIIAGINLANNTFVIDSLAFYGVSGGPVVQINEDKSISIIGVISRYIPFITEWRNKHEKAFSRQDFFNSGYAVCEPLDQIINVITS